MASQGQIIIEIIPQLELIIGKQPSLPELPPIESRNSLPDGLPSVHRRRHRSRASSGTLSDDMQWADRDSLNLIEHIITHPDTRYLMVIGAYRDNEVAPSHPLMLTIEEVRQTVTPLELHLGPLDGDALRQLVADTLHCEAETVKPLTALVLSKTDGNPFFANQFLRTLHEEGLILFDVSSSCWRWDLDRIRGANVTDNIVEMMAEQISRLEISHPSGIEASSLSGQPVRSGYPGSHKRTTGHASRGRPQTRSEQGAAG